MARWSSPAHGLVPRHSLTRPELNTAQLKRFYGKFPGASSRLYGHPSNVLVYYVGGKKFAYFKTSEPERWRFSFHVTPEQFLALTDVPGIKPARYMARNHWITVVRVESMPAAYLKDLVTASYQRALDMLSRKRRAELTRH